MTDYIGYEALTQAAMRGVMRGALMKAVANGAPPGNHHFYISFRTRAPGVKIASHLVERFPEDMTIVIQHQYWDLEVDETHLEIILKFSGVPQHLSIPFTAVTRFVDPSINFSLSFQPEASDSDNEIVDPVPEQEDKAQKAKPEKRTENEGTVVNLDAFRCK